MSAFVKAHKIRNAIAHDLKYDWPGSPVEELWDRDCCLCPLPGRTNTSCFRTHYAGEKKQVVTQIFDALIVGNQNAPNLNTEQYVHHLRALFHMDQNDWIMLTKDKISLIFYANIGGLIDEFEEQNKTEQDRNSDKQQFHFDPFSRLNIFTIIENIGLLLKFNKLEGKAFSANFFFVYFVSLRI